MIGGGEKTVAFYLAINMCAPPQGALESLHQNPSRPFGDHKAVPIKIKRPARPLRLIVAGRERPERAKAGEAKRRDGRLAPSGQDGIGQTLAQRLEGFADGMSAACASSHRA